jgi:hypothetical protein
VARLPAPSVITIRDVFLLLSVLSGKVDRLARAVEASNESEAG